jgi:hypothetical protein
MSLTPDPNQSIGTIQQGTMSVNPAPSIVTQADQSIGTAQTLNQDYAAAQKAAAEKAAAAAAANGNRVIANQSIETGQAGIGSIVQAPRPLTAADQSIETGQAGIGSIVQAPRPLTAANQSIETGQAGIGSIVQAPRPLTAADQSIGTAQSYTMPVGPEEKAAADAAAAQAAAQKAAAATRIIANQSIEPAQESITQDAAKAAFAGSFTVCPPGMTDTRDGYCQPPIVPFLTTSGAVSGDCPPNTTLVAGKGCLPAKILSWAPGAILIPYLSELSTKLYNINTAINNTTKISSPIALAINNAATKNLTGITDLSTSINTINESLRASQPATSYGGRRTRKKRGRRGNRKTKNTAK